MNVLSRWENIALGATLIALLGGCGCICNKTKTEEQKTMRDLFIFFGPPACGKGTLATRLKEDMNFLPVSTGDVLRQNVGQGTELGQKAQPIMARGELVPDELMNDMIKDWLKQQAAGTQPIILDGFPRTIGQAQALLDMLKNSSYHLRIVRFSISEQEAVDRIVYRVVCSNKACQKVYSLKSLKPKVDGICDVCGSKLLKRSDDTEEVIKKRYNDYMKTENEMLNFFKNQGIEIDNISTEQSMNDVYNDFKKLL